MKTTSFHIYTLLIEGGEQGFYQEISTNDQDAWEKLLEQYHEEFEAEDSNTHYHQTFEDLKKYWDNVALYKVPIYLTKELGFETPGYILIDCNYGKENKSQKG